MKEDEMGTRDGLPPDVSSALQGVRRRIEPSGSVNFNFDVHSAKNMDDLLAQINACLEAFAPKSRWEVGVYAAPAIVNGVGATVSFSASVEARWLGPE